MAIGLLLLTTGCQQRLWVGNLASFGLGWILRDLTMPVVTETVCYRNGVQIDCAELEWE